MKSFSNHSISLVIPIFNEDEIIEQCVNKSIQILSTHFIDYELLIIDDGSTDKTSIILENLSQIHSKLRVISNNQNLGIGKSLLSGLKSASKDLIIHNGADSPFNLEDLDKLITKIDSYDIIIVARNNHTGYTLYRRIISYINKSLLKTLFPLKVNDYNFVQIYRKEVIDKITPNARSAGFLIPEILITAHNMGYRMQEIHLDYHARISGKASAGKISILIHSFFDMMRFFIKHKISCLI